MIDLIFEDRAIWFFLFMLFWSALCGFARGISGHNGQLNKWKLARYVVYGMMAGMTVVLAGKAVTGGDSLSAVFIAASVAAILAYDIMLAIINGGKKALERFGNDRAKG